MINNKPVFLPTAPSNPFLDAIHTTDQAQLLTELLLRILPQDQIDLLNQTYPAPTVDQLLPHVSVYLRQHLRLWFDTKVDDLMLLLESRGREYGEEVLMVMGEPGMFEMSRVKLHRLKGSMEQGAPLADRHDTWIDIAGYCILILAMADWKENGMGRIGGPNETD